MRGVLALCLLGCALGLFDTSAYFQRTTTHPIPAAVAGRSVRFNSTITPPPTRSPPVGEGFTIAEPTVNARDGAKITYWSSGSNCPAYGQQTYSYKQGACVPNQFWWYNGDKRVTCAQPGSASSAWTLETWTMSAGCTGSAYETVSGTGLACVTLPSIGSVTVDCRGGGSFDAVGTLKLNATTEEGWISTVWAEVTGPDGLTKGISCTSDATFGPNGRRCEFTFNTWNRPGAYRVTQVTITNIYGTATTYTTADPQLPASLAFILQSRVDITPPRVSNVQVSAGSSDRVVILEEESIYSGYTRRQQQSVRVSFKATDDASGFAGATAVFTIEHGGRTFPRTYTYSTSAAKLDGAYSFSFSNIMLIPGRWVLRELHAWDVAGNMATLKLVDIVATKGSAVVDAVGPPLRLPTRPVSLLGLGISPYLDLRTFGQYMDYNMTLQGFYNMSTAAIQAECNYRLSDDVVFTQSYATSLTRVTDADGNTAIRGRQYISSNKHAPGTYRLMGCIVEVREYGVVQSAVFGEITESQQAHLDRWTYKSAASSFQASMPVLAILAALATALAAAF